MANPYKGEVEVQALGKAWTMRLGMNEAIELQGALGLDEDAGPDELIQKLQGMKTLKALRDFFHVVLKFAHPDITLQKAGEIVTELGLMKAATAVTQCLKWAMPDPDAAPGGGGAKGKGKGGGSPGATS